MLRMVDIHAVASEIDTPDADAVQQLADDLAAEHYAADIAAYSDHVRDVIEMHRRIGEKFCIECACV